MSDTVYENALKRQAELKQELLEIEGFLRLWQRFSGVKKEQNILDDMVKHITTDSIQAAANQIDARKKRAKDARDSPRGLPRHAVGKWARQFMMEADHPLTRGQLVQEFADRGLPLGGKERERNMGTIMWRLNEEFVNLEGFGYWPRDVNYKPANYVAPMSKLKVGDAEKAQTGQSTA